MAKLLPQRSSAIVKYSSSEIAKQNKSLAAKNKKTKISPSTLLNSSLAVSTKKTTLIEGKLIKIDSILKKSLLTSTKENQKKRQSKEKDEFNEREKELEKKTKEQKIKGINLPKLPGFGLFGLIKNFIFNTLLGFIAIRLVDHLPKLLKLLPVIFKVGDFIIDISGKLLNGLVTFIDWGYKAVDSTRGFVKDKFGEDVLKNFDAIGKHLNTFFNLSIIAGLLAVKSGGIGRGSKGGGPTSRPGQGGRPRVTTSGGGRAGGLNVRNPLRQRPTVTTSTGGLNVRNPLRQRPRVTTSGGGKGALGLGTKIGTKGLFVVGPLIDIAIRTLVFNDPLDKAIAGAAGVAAGQALGSWIGGIIGGVAGSVVPVLGNIIGAGTGALIGGVLGGFLGDFLGVSLYNFINQNKTTNQLQGGGVPTTKESKQPIKQKGRRTLSKKKKARTLSFTPKKIRPGSSVGGDEKVQSVFPNPDKPKGFLGWLGGLFGGGAQQPEQNQEQEIKKTKSANPQEFLARSNDILGRADFFGPFFTLAYKSVLGDKPNKLDYRNAGMGLNAWMQQTFSTAALGFAGGGEVDASEFFKGEDYTDVIAKSVEESVSGGVDTTIRGLAKELAMRPVGREEMLQENLQPDKGINQKSDPNLEVGPGGIVTGGNADFWTLVAIASREDGDPQGWADVAQSIYNRVASGVYGAKTIQGIVTRQGQYEPTWKYPRYGKKGVPNSDWFNIKDAASASRATGMSVTAMNSVAAALRNKRYQDEAAKFVGGRTDFMGGSNQPGPGDVRRKENTPNNFFGWFVGPGSIAYGRKNPGPAKAPQLGDIVVMGGDTGAGGDVSVTVKGGKAFPLPKGMIGTGSGQVYGASRSYGGHAGVDVVEKPPWGRDPKIPVVAYAGGKVVQSSPRYSHKTSGYTSNLTIDHGSFKATYLHMTPSLSPGSMVAPGQKVGNLIDLGNQTHLHFESYKNGRSFNPTGLLRAAYAKGGETIGEPHLAVLGDGGKPEYVISGDAYEQTEKAVPGLLDVINYGIHDRTTLRKNMPDVIESVNRYASYEDEAQQIVIIDDEINDTNETQNVPFSALVLNASISNIDNSAYETLEML